MKTILGICGSLRADSYNLRLLKAVGAAFDETVSFSVFGATDIPVFNEDLEGADEPLAVTQLKEAIANADGVVFATPEYNGAIPGSTKNLVDWASRKPSPINNKPVAILGGSGGRFGTAHAQLMLRHTLSYLGCSVMPAPLVAIAHVANVFDGDVLTDDPTRNRLETFASAVSDWVDRVA